MTFTTIKKKTLKHSKRGWLSTQRGGKKEFSNFVLLLKGLFGYSETLATPHELWNCLVNFPRKGNGDFSRDRVESADLFTGVASSLIK